MKIIDLTHSISPNMPVYPGTEPPVFITGCSIDDVGFLEKKITMYSHTGTHIDAPAHIFNGAKTLDQFSLEHFFGKTFLLNLRLSKKQPITINDLEPHQDLIKNSDFLLLNTGWSQFWNSKSYFHDYPVLSADAASWLINCDLKGVGSDTISADEFDSQDFPIHNIFLSHDVIIIENLTNLDALAENQFLFSCLPLTIEQADGSPVRAVAIIL
jgi:kynurenine formamidase